MPKVRWIVKTAWRFGQMAHWQSRVLQGLRNFALRRTPKWINDRQVEKICSLNY
jgi:hypothetical protein